MNMLNLRKRALEISVQDVQLFGLVLKHSTLANKNKEFYVK